MADRVLDNRYELQGEIGRGGMAVVYRGVDRTLDRPVAIKVIRQDLAQEPTFLERFRREASAAAGLSHQNIVSIYDAHLSEPPYYIVSEYVSGGSLHDRLTVEGALPVEEAVRLASGVCEALSHAHAHGLIHRDVKPQNILLTGPGAPKLADFGIAHALATPRLTQTGLALGTAHYASPEQAKGEPLDLRSDLYSLGAVLFEMLTGQVPFDAETPVAVGVKHLTEPLPSLRALRPEIPAAVEAVVRKAMAKDPAARYQSAAEMKAALDRAWGGVVEQATSVLTAPPTVEAAQTTVLPTPTPAVAPVPVPVPRPPARPQYERRPRGPGAGSIVAALLAVVVIAGLIFAWKNSQGTGDIVVPDVVGETEWRGKRALEELGLQMVVEERRTDERVPGGRIISQRPPAGRKVAEGEKVAVVISKGPRYVQVPDLEGMTVAQAKKVLQNNGLSLGRQEEASDPQRPEGCILAQDPAAGRSVDKGSGVTVYVNRRGAAEVPEEIAEEASPEEIPEQPEEAEGKAKAEGEGLSDVLREKAKEKAGEFVDEAVEAMKEKAKEKVEEAKEKAKESLREKADDLKESLPWNKPAETEGEQKGGG